MVTEFRQIVFSDHDLKSAIVSFNNSRNLKLLKGPVRSINLQQGETISASLVVDTQVGGETEIINMEAAYLGAAMLTFCFELGIPIPKESQKNIEMVGDNLALNISINASKTSVSDTN